MKSCLPPLHNLLGNRWHCASDKKKIDWLLNGISTADFQINVRLSILSSRLFRYQIDSVSLCACVCVCYFFTFFVFFFLLFRLFTCVFDLDVHLYFLIFKIKQRKLSR